MKKIISTLLVISMLFTLGIVSSANDVDVMEISIGSANADAGETVDVDISIGGTPIVGLMGTITAGDGLSIEDVRTADSKLAVTFNKADSYIVVDAAENFEGGTIATITVKVDENADGNIEIGFNVEDAGYLEDGKYVKASTSINTGTITVKPKPHTHTYGEPTYEWAKDYTSCTATFACECGDPEAVESITCEDVKSSYDKETNCVIYTATFVFNEETYTATAEAKHTEHIYSEWTITEKEHYHVCDVCENVADKADHEFGEWTTEKDPTEAEEGLKYCICSECGYRKDETIDKLDHVWKDDFDCDETSHWHSCTNDGCNEKNGIENHTFDKVDGQAATCVEDGFEKYECSICHYTKEVVVKAPGHTWGDWITDSEPTKTEEGSEHRVCSVCGENETRSIPKIEDPPIIIVDTPSKIEYTITTEAGKGGSITGTFEAERGSDAKIVIIADKGYKIADVIVDGNSVGAVSEYCFENVKKHHTVKAVFEKLAIKLADEDFEAWENPFTDVTDDADYYEAIAFANINRLFKGVSETEFAPDSTMTRAMFVTVLGRLAGVDTSLYETVDFDDVVEGEWYAPYVAWAAENEIVIGYGNGCFGVDDEVTIEQAAVIIARYAEFAGLDVTAEAFENEYVDAKLVSDWALSQMMWADINGIYSGNDGLLNPQQKAPRSLAAQMLYALAVELN